MVEALSNCVMFTTRRRCRDDIIADILRTLQGDNVKGVTVTTLMFRTRTPFLLLQDYLSLLAAQHLVQYDAGRRVYRLAAKGFRYLDLYDGLRETVAEGSLSQASAQ